jgi:hypothetical protein
MSKSQNEENLHFGTFILILPFFKHKNILGFIFLVPLHEIP